jgi:hypothetical protein
VKSENIIYLYRKMEEPNINNDIGLWDFYKDEIIEKTIMYCNADINIGELIEDVNEFIELHLGKLPSLEKLSKELKLSIKNLYVNEKSKKKIFEKIKNENNEEINLMFAMEKVNKNGDCFCNIFNIIDAYNCCTIKIRITISKPSNLIATNICNNFMDKKIREIIISKAIEGNTFRM